MGVEPQGVGRWVSSHGGEGWETMGGRGVDVEPRGAGGWVGGKLWGCRQVAVSYRGMGGEMVSWRRGGRSGW